MLACEKGHVECAQLLLEYGADPWVGDLVVRRTCIHYAAGTGHDAVRDACVSPAEGGGGHRYMNVMTRMGSFRTGGLK